MGRLFGIVGTHWLSLFDGIYQLVTLPGMVCSMLTSVKDVQSFGGWAYHSVDPLFTAL